MPTSIKKFGLAAITLVLLLTMHSCKKESRGSCFMGAGGDASESRSITLPFSEIKAEDNIHILLVQDSLNYIELTGGKNLLPYVETKVVDGVLHFENHAKCQFFKGYEHEIHAVLHFTTFKTIWNWGSGHITSNDTLHFDTLILNAQESIGNYELLIDNYKTVANLHTGVSDFILKGKSNNFYSYSRGTGNIFASDLHSDFAYANNISALDFFVGETKTLEALIQYKGNVFYRGNPVIQFESIKGEGQLLRE